MERDAVVGGGLACVRIRHARGVAGGRVGHHCAPARAHRDAKAQCDGRRGLWAREGWRVGGCDVHGGGVGDRAGPPIRGGREVVLCRPVEAWRLCRHGIASAQLRAQAVAAPHSPFFFYLWSRHHKSGRVPIDCTLGTEGARACALR